MAMTELRGRLLYRRYRQAPSSVSRENILAVQKEWEEQRRKLDALRGTIPECEGKRYWWDISYDVEAPFETFESCLSLPQGVTRSRIILRNITVVFWIVRSSN